MPPFPLGYHSVPVCLPFSALPRRWDDPNLVLSGLRVKVYKDSNTTADFTEEAPTSTAAQAYEDLVPGISCPSTAASCFVSPTGQAYDTFFAATVSWKTCPSDAQHAQRGLLPLLHRSTVRALAARPGVLRTQRAGLPDTAAA